MKTVFLLCWIFSYCTVKEILKWQGCYTLSSINEWVLAFFFACEACKITDDMIFVLWLEITSKVVVNLVAYVCLFQLHYSANLFELECIANLHIVRICSVLLHVRICTLNLFSLCRISMNMDLKNRILQQLKLCKNIMSLRRTRITILIFPCGTNVDLTVVTLNIVELTILELSNRACTLVFGWTSMCIHVAYWCQFFSTCIHVAYFLGLCCNFFNLDMECLDSPHINFLAVQLL